MTISSISARSSSWPISAHIRSHLNFAWSTAYQINERAYRPCTDTWWKREHRPCAASFRLQDRYRPKLVRNESSRDLWKLSYLLRTGLMGLRISLLLPRKSGPSRNRHSLERHLPQVPQLQLRDQPQKLPYDVSKATTPFLVLSRPQTCRSKSAPDPASLPISQSRHL